MKMVAGLRALHDGPLGPSVAAPVTAATMHAANIEYPPPTMALITSGVVDSPFAAVIFAAPVTAKRPGAAMMHAANVDCPPPRWPMQQIWTILHQRWP